MSFAYNDSFREIGSRVMSKLLFMTLFCFHLLYWGENLMSKEHTLIFMSPILEGKTSILKEQIFSDAEENLLKNLEISKYRRWIQSINDSNFLIHQFEGKNLKKSFEDLKEKISQEEPTALALQNLYQSVLGIDIQKDDWIPQINVLTEEINMNIEHSDETFAKEYCFVYPILPSKKGKLIELYKDNAVYASKRIQNIYRFRGINKTQLWLQESSGNTFIIVYQEIIGPAANARNKYLNSKEDALSRYIADIYSEVTGLPYEKLLPILESLDDAEILK